MRSIGFRTAAWSFAIALIVAGCSAEGASTTTSRPPPIATTASLSPETTTTAQPLDIGAALIDVFGDPDFSATISYENRSTQESGDITFIGGGVIHGEDSGLWQVADTSGLERTFFDQNGRLIGPGGNTTTSQASFVVDGIRYLQVNGGRWVFDGPYEGETLFDHLFDRLATVDDYETIGSEKFQGEEMTVLTPAGGLTYSAAPFDVPSSAVESFDVLTEIVADSEGVPQVIRLSIDAEFNAGPSTHWDHEYRLSAVGSTGPLAPPSRPWTTITSLGFALDEMEGDWVDLSVPADWEVVNRESGLIQLVTTEGRFVSVFGFLFNSPYAVSSFTSDFLDAAGIPEQSTSDPGWGLFDGRLATSVNENGRQVVYAETQTFLTLALVSASSPDFPVEQDLEIQDLASTIVWKNPDRGEVVPGLTLGNPLLQTDARDLLAVAASARTGGECEQPRVMWTEVVGGDHDYWAEDWFLDVCGDIHAYEVEFLMAPDGGTNILTSSEPRIVGATSADEPPLGDAAAVADLLRSKPWLVPLSSGLSEAEIAASVTRERFDGGALYVLVVPEGSLGFEEVQSLGSDVFDALGRGVLLLVGVDFPAGGYANTSVYGDAVLDDAFAAADSAIDPASAVVRFVEVLLGG